MHSRHSKTSSISPGNDENMTQENEKDKNSRPLRVVARMQKFSLLVIIAIGTIVWLQTTQNPIKSERKEKKETATKKIISRTADDTAEKTNPINVIPPCPSSPWKNDENLMGKCPGGMKPFQKDGVETTLESCAAACCASDKCISWQFRRDVGCLHGGDIRLGMEKDGPSGWCASHPPYRWKGQYLVKRGQDEEAETRRRNACDETTWNPEEQEGQCFGLGDVKKDASGSAEDCRSMCCGDDKCGAWQWHADLGCFYGKGMHGCTGADDPVFFEPFVGRRKILDSRSYTDKKGQVWKQPLEG